jgi:trans-enoyl reductase
VVTTVGPYAQYGLALVAACVKAGTDYADLTGELLFVRDCIDLYHKQAVDTGARIVVSCGFDSVPSDLNVYQLHRRALADGAGELTDTTLVLRSFSQLGASGGTVASLLGTMRTASGDEQARRIIDDPYTFTTDRDAEPDLGRQPDFAWRRGRDVAPELAGVWVGGFVMGPYNARIVRRSNALQGWSYGRRFRYLEAQSLGRSFAAPVASAIATATLAAANRLGNRYFGRLPRRLVEFLTPRAGAGPGAAARRRGHYTVETYSTTTTGARYMAAFGQDCDAYQGTSVLLGESGLALALDRDRLSGLHGVLTPAAAMGDPLLDRLAAAGVSLGTTRLG